MKTHLLVATTVAIAMLSVQPSAQNLKYPVARKGTQDDTFFGVKVADPYRWLEDSDSAETRAWIEWRVRDVATSKDLPDLVKWSKFSDASWLKDGSGFYYSRYDEPKGEALQALNKN